MVSSGVAPAELVASRSMMSRSSTRPSRIASRQPITARTAEDNATGRLQDMDVEGRDIDFLIPGTWAYGAPSLAPPLFRGLYSAYHRYMAEYCAADSRRLKSMVLAPANDPVWSAQAIKAHAHEEWVAAVWRKLPLPLTRGVGPYLAARIPF